MTIRRRDIAALGVAATGLAAAAAIARPALAQPKPGDSTWELIKKNGAVRMGVFEYPPYFVRNKTSGEWEGAMVEMGKDIANELKVKFVPVEVGGFAEAVLSLHASKVDMNFGLQATPVRAAAIDFAGPIYWIEWVTVNNPNFKGRDWADYNKENVKVAVMTGTSDELLLRKMAPKATRVEFKLIADVALAVSSGRADAFTTTVLASMVMKQKNPALGDFVNPKPRVALPGYIGLRLEEDQRWQKFLNRWAEWNILLGHNERRMREALAKDGLEVPSTVSFSPN
ncbi:MAG: transporter substrate-binding domain-containing protein [Alphaproteobacteria bacterium]|nr:MAG: transporter substrate-binding domain-containing protein [Alphaproteobacteria bacterium]